MMSMVHAQIKRAISNIVSSMSSSGNRDTEASLSPNSQENRGRMTGTKNKITKKDSRSACDLKDSVAHSPYKCTMTQKKLFLVGAFHFGEIKHDYCCGKFFFVR